MKLILLLQLTDKFFLWYPVHALTHSAPKYSEPAVFMVLLTLIHFYAVFIGT